MMWSLPIAVEIDGKEYKIRNQCDYRVVLDVIAVLNDNGLEISDRLKCALFIFFEDLSELKDAETAIKEMFKIINNGEVETQETEQSQRRLMDWEHDFQQVVPPINRVLGYDVRTADKYTHWWTFIGGYMEIGECTFSNIVSIRNKKQKRKPLKNGKKIFTEKTERWLIYP